MRIVVGPGDSATRLVAKSLYGRVEVAKGDRMQDPAEPVGLPWFNRGCPVQFGWPTIADLIRRNINVFDSMRLIDVSPLYRKPELAPQKFEEKPAPPWLADIASAVSASDPSQDGSLMTLDDVRKRYPESKAGDAYEAVWKRFFPE